LSAFDIALPPTILSTFTTTFGKSNDISIGNALQPPYSYSFCRSIQYPYSLSIFYTNHRAQSNAITNSYSFCRSIKYSYSLSI
jgi:hypothetical protein